MARLATGLGKRATLVAAGPGYGKSTAVRAYLAESGLPAVWLNLSPNEAGREAFLRLLLAGAQQIGLPVPPDAEPLLASAPQAWLSVLETLLDAWAEVEAHAIVLDDLHVLEDGGALDVVAFLVEAMPETIQLLITSRAEPAGLRLGQWRVRQQVVDVGPSALRFAPDELASLLQGMTGLTPQTDALSRLVSSTDGWIAGVILAIHAMQAEGAVDADRLLALVEDPETSFAYLAEEVFHRQDEPLRRFMLRAALLPELDTASCQKALADDQASSHLRDLQRRHLFIQPAASGGYQFHPLFRTCLLRLGETLIPPDERQRLLRTIAPDLDPETAIAMHLGEGQTAAALRVLADAADRYLIEGAVIRLGSLLAGFPTDAHADPWWRLLQAETERQSGRLQLAGDRLRPLLEVADPVIRGRASAILGAVLGASGQGGDREAAEAALQTLPASDHWGRAFAANVAGLHWIGANDPTRAEASLQEALASFSAAADAFGQTKVLINLGLQATRHGHLSAAEDFYQRATDMARTAGRAPQPVIYQNRASVANYRGDHARALALVDEGLSLATALDFQRDAALLRYTRGRTLQHLGDLSAAAQDYSAAQRWADAAGDKALAAQVRLGFVELALKEQRLADASRLLAEAEAIRALPADHPARLDFQFPKAQILLAMGDWPAAAAVVDPLVERMRFHGFRLRLAHALRYQTLLRRAIGDDGGAEASDAECRDLCAAEGYTSLPGDDGIADQAVPEPEVAIRCFGRFDVAIAGERVPAEAWLGHKTRMILAMLLLEPQGLSRDILSDWLYPDQDVSRSAVLTLINRLRKAVDPGANRWSGGGLVLWRNGRYVLNEAIRLRSDLQAFQEAWEAARSADEATKAERYRLMIELYKGPLFGEFHRETWAVLPVERAQRQWQEAYSWLQSWTLAQGSPSGALDLADANLALDPTAEAVHRFKIETLLKLGLRDAARRHYDAMATCLQRELGTGPSAETAALLAQISG
jgi:LuxR family maltose regulon positive regulatory protein